MLKNSCGFFEMLFRGTFFSLNDEKFSFFYKKNCGSYLQKNLHAFVLLGFVLPTKNTKMFSEFLQNFLTS
jgi:hypothetical protein